MQTLQNSAVAISNTSAGSATNSNEGRGLKVRAMLKARLGEDIFTSWFNALEFDSFDGKTVRTRFR